MPVADRLPPKVRARLRGHGELVRFAIVGGTAFMIDTAIFFTLKSTLLEARPVTAKVIATTIATIVSYLLNRNWSFRYRGGRPGHHELMLYFLVSALAVVVNSAPLFASRYVFHLATPYVGRLTQELADFVSAQIVGTAIAMVFRWWAFRRFVFPQKGRGAAQRAAAKAAKPRHQLVSVAQESVPGGD